MFDNSVLWNVDLSVGAGRSGFEFLRGGSGTFVNNKVNGFQYDVLINRTCSSCGNTETATMLIGHSSFENATKASVAALQASPGADYAVLTLATNEFSNFGSYAQPLNGDVYVGTGTPGGSDANWIRGIVLVGNQHTDGYNTTGGAQAVIDIEDGQSVSIHAEKYSNNGTAGSPQMIKVGTAVNGCRLGGNDVYNSAATAVYNTLGGGGTGGTGCNPTVSACGTSPSITPQSTDESGAITGGSGGSALTSCSLTFRQRFGSGNNPNCTFSTNQAGLVVSLAAIADTGITFSATDLRGVAIYYNCRTGG